MIAVLSPAKNLDFSSDLSRQVGSVPEFNPEANHIAGILRKMSIPDLAALLQTNQKLTLLNADRYAAWQKEPAPDVARPAMFAYHGEVYHGLDANSLNDTALKFAQEHLVILSGLYGMLRPSDLIQPYRLEMQAPLRIKGAKNLYEFWSGKITRKILSRLNNQPDRVIINLASKEYFSVVNWSAIEARIITPVFKDFHDGQYKFMAIYGKKARGLMARFMVQHEISEPEQLKLFDLEGYYYSELLSKGDEWIFTRG